jgi:hypothetical protein
MSLAKAVPARAAFLDVDPISGAHTQPSITTTSSEALAAETGRRYLLLVNGSDTVIYCNVGAAAVLNEGIMLTPKGGYYSMTVGDGNIDTDAVNAIHGGSGNKTLLIVQGT